MQSDINLCQIRIGFHRCVSVIENDNLTISNGISTLVFENGSEKFGVIKKLYTECLCLNKFDLFSLSLEERYILNQFNDYNWLVYLIEDISGNTLFRYLPDITGPYGSTPSLSRMLIGPFCGKNPLYISSTAYFRSTASGILVEGGTSHGSILIEEPKMIGEHNLLDKNKWANPKQEDEYCNKLLILILVNIGALRETSDILSFMEFEFEELVFHNWSRSEVVTYGYGRKSLEGNYSICWGDSSKKIMLPENNSDLSNKNMENLSELIYRRQSKINFTKSPFTLSNISMFLWNLTHVRDDRVCKRAYPSAGGLYGIHFFIIGKIVEPFKDLLYRYCPRMHCLIEHQEKEDIINGIALNCRFYGGISSNSGYELIILLVADIKRYYSFYDRIGYSSALKEAGSIIEIASLIAVALDFNFCPIGGGYKYINSSNGNIKLPILAEFILSK